MQTCPIIYARSEAACRRYGSAPGLKPLRPRGYVKRTKDGWEVWLYIPTLGGYKRRCTLERTRADARLTLKVYQIAY